MNAVEIVSYLLEAAKATVYAFIPRLTDKYGVGVPPVPNEDPYTTWSKAFVSQAPELDPELAAQAQENPEEFIRMLVDQFDATFILVLDGEASVISRRRRGRLPKEFLTKVQSMVNIQPSDRVGWFSSIDAHPVPSIAAEVIYGQEAEDVEFEKTRPKMSKPLSREERSALRRKFWSGHTDPGSAPDIVDKLLQ